MAQLEFCDKHNMVAYLVKSESSEGFDEIIDFLTSSHIYYALTENPIIFVSLIEQFWETAVLSTTEEGLQAISATIDGHEKLITEDSLRRHLKLDDAEGISSLSNEEIFEHLAHMGYVTNSESLTFFKDPAFDDLMILILVDDTLAYMESEVDQNEGVDKLLWAEKKFKSLLLIEEVARKVQEEGKLKRGEEKKRVKKDDSVNGEIKEEEGTRKRKLGKKKNMKSKKRKLTSKDDKELRLCLTIAPDEDKEVDYEILDKKYPIIEWRSEYLTTKPQYDETESRRMKMFI
ncbi:hypothetical protein Tco_1410655 [Tanacetum coccineum]